VELLVVLFSIRVPSEIKCHQYHVSSLKLGLFFFVVTFSDLAIWDCSPGLEMVKRFACLVHVYDDFMKDELNEISNWFILGTVMECSDLRKISCCSA